MLNKSILLLAAMGCTAAVCAQEGGSASVNTPYSMYGLGDFVASGAASAAGMGGLSAAIRDSRSINMANPAAASARDSLTFIIDVGGDMRNSYALSENTRSSFNSANFHHLAAGFPLWGKRMGVNLGFMPYTRVGYDIEQTETRNDVILSAGDVRYQYKGEKGISQMFVNVGFNILPQWSVGLGAQYYFGKINRYYNTVFPLSVYFDTYSQQSLQVSDFAWTLGTQYTHTLNNTQKLTMGLVLSPKTMIDATESEHSFNRHYNATDDTYIDTAYGSSKEAAFAMPFCVRAGLSWTKLDKWTAGIDFTLQDWSKTAISGRYEMGMAYDIRVGGSITPNRYDVRYYTKRMTYRAGLRYSQIPMMFGGNAITEKAVSAGIGLPCKGVGEVNFAAEYGRRGKAQNGGVREDYVCITLSVTLFEYWFVKYRYE